MKRVLLLLPTNGYRNDDCAPPNALIAGHDKPDPSRRKPLEMPFARHKDKRRLAIQIEVPIAIARDGRSGSVR